MSGRTWLCADHHISHAKILTFKDNDGNLIRGAHFNSIEEHDNAIIERHNAVVSDTDRVYMLGDVCINRRSLSTLARLRGRLVLVKGNHDIFKIEDYLPYFDDIRAYVVQKDHDGNKVILSHIPIHPESLGRFGRNIHGHLHGGKVMREGPYGSLDRVDERYVCVSLEHTNFSPIELHEALKKDRH